MTIFQAVMLYTYISQAYPGRTSLPRLTLNISSFVDKTNAQINTTLKKLMRVFSRRLAPDAGILFYGMRGCWTFLSAGICTFHVQGTENEKLHAEFLSYCFFRCYQVCLLP